MTNELSQTPLGPSVPSPDVDVCAALSLFWKVTDSPGLIVIVAGRKQSGSHPGVDEPAAFWTTFSGCGVGSGYDCGVYPPSSTITNPVIQG